MAAGWFSVYLFWVTLQVAEQYFFEPGFTHHYTYSSTTDTLGMHNVTTVIRFQIRDVNQTRNASLFELKVDSLTQHSQKGHYAVNPLKWDLSRHFLFELGETGLVHFVHYHPEDAEEVVTIKKAVVGTMSTHFQASGAERWTYTSEEIDHGGHLLHTYEAQKTTDGVRMTRQHHSSDSVIRTHTKEVHYNKEGMIHQVHLVDNITMQNSKETKVRNGFHDNGAIKIYSSGDFPTIQTIGETHVVFQQKIKHMQPNNIIQAQLVKDILTVVKRPEERLALEKLEKNINSLIECIHKFDDKTAVGRTKCVNMLQSNVTCLIDSDLKVLADRFLVNRCEKKSDRCVNERHLIIDVIARLGSNVAQQLIIKHVLNNTDATEEELRHALIHSIGFQIPIAELVSSVEFLCFSENLKQEPSIVSDTQRRACLTFGAIIKNLRLNGNTTLALRLVNKLEEIVGHHNESEFQELYKPRNRRSAENPHTRENNHLKKKRMLVHALGNAGHPNSLQHIVSYMQTDQATPSLRRAAAYALRHFSCNKSADALIKAAVNDPENIVKQAAFEVYSTHPAGKTFTKEQENIILSAHYSYPVVARVRRGTFADILKALSFELVLPKVDWKKVIGTNKIGASFGIIMENYIKLKLAPFNGVFDLKVHDEAWAVGNLGLINKFIDIFRVKVCYQLNFHYDLNILKDFGIDSIQNLASAFDRLFHKIVDPIKDAIDLISDLIDMGRNHIFEKMITDLVALFKELPSLIKEMAENLYKSMLKLNSFDGYPLVDRVKKLITRIRVFIDDVKADIFGFYHSVADAITVSLPFVGKEIKEGFELIGDSWKFWENPIASFHGMENALLKFKLAVVTFVEAKQRVMDSLNVFKGGLPYWFHPVEEVKGMVNDVMDIMGMIKDEIIHYGDSASAQSCTIDITDGLTMCENKNSIHKLVDEAVVPVVNRTLFRVKEIAKPFWDKATEMIDLFKRIKSSYDFIREAINKGKYFVQKIFGAKFHRKFPKRPGPCENPSCACGEYRKRDDGRFGLDLEIDSKSKFDVINPMTGLVSWYKENEVLIIPHRPDVIMYEIIVSNLEQIEPKIPRNMKKKFYLGGHKIGRVVDKVSSEECEFNFVTVYMRKRLENTTGVSEDKYEYIDPSKYLRNKKPKSFWKPVCKEAFYHYIGQVADDLDLGDEPEEDETETSREVDSKKIKGPKFLHRHHVGKRSVEVKHESHLLNTREVHCDESNEKSFTCKLKAFTTKVGELKERLMQKAGAIMPRFNVYDISISEIQKLPINQTLLTKLNVSIRRLSDVMKKAPIEFPDSLPIHRIRHKLREAGADYHDVVNADRMSLVDKLLTIPLKECPLFVDAVALEYGHLCDAHKDCLGLTCGAVFKEGYQRHLIKFTVRWNSCKKEFEVSFDGMKQLKSVKINETLEYPYEVSSETTKEILFLMSSTAISNTTYLFNMSGSICNSEFFSCFEDVNILTNLNVSHPSSEFCGEHDLYDPYIERIQALNLQEFIEECSEFGLDIHSQLILVNHLREEVMDVIMKLQKDIPEAIESAFPAMMDLKMSKFIPLGHIDIRIFEINFLFMVGPIPLHLSFGAGANIGADLEIALALMSLQANGTVIPRIGATVWGELNLDIGIAYGGIRLEGHLVQTSFPITISLTFSKFPIATVFKLDLELVPLELRLKAHAKLRLLFVSVTVFDACIWRYKMATIRKNLKTIEHKRKDDSPPKISHVSQNVRRKRNGEGGCEITQLRYRDPTDPAFLLEVSADDEVSDVTLTYAIGTHRGGSNVMDWTGMKGSSVTAPVNLPNGVPLYWTVKARNSNGGTSTVECSLNTYDNTIPDGRIEASYPFTSNPSKLSGTVVVFDDSNLAQSHTHSVGFSQGEFGNEVLNWDVLYLQSTHKREDAEGSHLQYFTIPREGKLTSLFMQRLKVTSADHCAERCINYGDKCISFDYEFHTETCDLQAVIEGPKAELRVSGTYKNYERLGVGYDAFLSYNISLQHGSRYFMNAEITNELGYRAFITSKGTIVDYTPPEPVNVGNASKDYMVADGCKAAITQQCVDVTPRLNHRRIIDGENASTVFNGHESLKETLYTLTNHFISANFDKFLDKESGIYGYTWAAGTSICGTDIVSFANPHAHLSSPTFWTYTGYARNIHLSDGQYYVTVQALNNVVHGGSLVTTVCKSVPLTVDTTPPEFKGLTDIIFDEDFNLMALYFGAEDPLSKIARVDFGLGKTKHDVEVRGYTRFDYMQTENPYIVIKDLNITDGEPAWIRLRAVNNVDLFTAGHSDDPILIDRTMPFAGSVYDGSKMDEDVAFQSKTNEMCASWKGFYDPESGISQYTWGVGTDKGKDDIVPFTVLSRDVKEKCAEATVKHNEKYFSTIIAKNSALNPKTIKATSDGVLIDTTPPTSGLVIDGDDPFVDMAFSSETAEISAIWNGFLDVESNIVAYTVHVFINGEESRTFHAGSETNFKDFSMTFRQGDHVRTRITAENGAGLVSSSSSSGFVIDLTPPIVQFVYSSDSGKKYQTNDSLLSLKWLFNDPESGMKLYRYRIYDSYQGMKTAISREYTTNVTSVEFPLNLSGGHSYSVKVIAINNANMPISQESEGVMIDTSPPKIREIHIGLINIPEDALDNGTVMHADEKRLTVSLRALDVESGISKIYIAILSDGLIPATYDYKSFEFAATIDVEGLTLIPSNVYRLHVIVENGAGINSTVKKDKTIYIMKKNVPGIVFDGRELLKDNDYTFDKTSVAMSFVGFESESCNIVLYEWAIGYQPFTYDVLPFTDYGIVMLNESFGQGQISLQLYEDSTYYITVRARTGYNCKVGQYIVSTSDGIKLDTTPPDLKITEFDGKDINSENLSSSLYQDRTDAVSFRWSSSDSSGVAKSWWSIGSLPEMDDIHPKTFTDNNFIPPGAVSFTNGQTYFLNTGAIDNAGNEVVITSRPITVDTTAPVIQNYICTPYISERKALVECQWDMIQDQESMIKKLYVGVGKNETTPDISDFHELPIQKRNWVRDMHARLKSHACQKVYVIVKLINGAEFTTIQSYGIVVDRTPPEKGNVEVITTLDLEKPPEKQLCQIPQTFIEVKTFNWNDKESGILSYEVAVGTDGKTTNIKDFFKVENPDKIFVNNIFMPESSKVYVTVRAFNKAGLYSQQRSNPVVISPHPFLQVTDGPSDTDIDYQSSLGVLQGRWKYSDPCYIQHAEWSVELLDGSIFKEFSVIPKGLTHFYSDMIALKNGITYINVVKVVDALNRTRISRSNGVAVKIQPPVPGSVRDGLSEDINYQESSSTLSANWDVFGENSKDPTQQIVYYEVSVGNDRRFPNTRTNVHYFENVGLNTSYTFTGLNLTAKIVQYFITVRAMSRAGSTQEGYSNGIRVGYRNEIIPGRIEHSKVQSSISEISVSWTGFQADMGINYFQIGVSSVSPSLPNGTINCEEFDAALPELDEVPVFKVKTDTFYQFKDLHLKHNHTYYVVVVASDVTGRCIGIHGDPLLVDTTPPVPGGVYVEGSEGNNVLYSIVSDHLELRWDPFVDEESNVKRYQISIFTSNVCTDEDVANIEDSLIYTLVTEDEVENDNKIAFYGLQLKPGISYVGRIKAWNEAGLETNVVSKHIRFDFTSPLPGAVKRGHNWLRELSFQPFTDHLNGLFAISTPGDKSLFTCESQKSLLPAIGSVDDFVNLDEEFSSECTEINQDRINLIIRHSDNLKSVIKGGILVKSEGLRPGNYTVKIKSVLGRNMVSTIFFGSNRNAILSDFEYKPERKLNVSFKEWSDKSGISVTNITDLGNATTSVEKINTTGRTNNSESNVDHITVKNDFDDNKNTSIGSKENSIEMGKVDEFSYGVHIPGYQFEMNWVVFFWIKDVYRSEVKQVFLDFDPNIFETEFSFDTSKTETPTQTIWGLKFFINGKLKGEYSGLKFSNQGEMGIYNWNKNNYFPPISNPELPIAYKSTAVITGLKIPLSKLKPCMRGLPFLDSESGIKEVHIGLSDSKNVNDSASVSSFSLFKTFCKPCSNGCNIDCNPSCTQHPSNFQIEPFVINNVSLQHATIDKTDIKSNGSSFSVPTYYINVKVINWAGLETIVTSDAIMVDITPPVLDFVRCLDPSDSMDAPSLYQGTNESMAAYWDGSEDVGDIIAYNISIGTKPGLEDIYQNTNVGLATKIKIDKLGDKLFHDHTYFITVTALNSADLTTSKTCNITVETQAPDISNLNVTLLMTKPYIHGVYTTENNRELGITWSGGKSDVEFYEWKVGSSPNTDDIFPRVKIGLKDSKKAEIEKGELLIDDTSLNASIGEYAQRNWTKEVLQEAKTNKLFNMEPGLCLYVTLFAVGRSHLSSAKQITPFCVKRNTDKLYLTNKRRRTSSSMYITRDIELIPSGSVISGHITETDYKQEYGSAASGSYVRYIVNPNDRHSDTSRFLRNRIMSNVEPSFYLSPTEDSVNVMTKIRFNSSKFDINMNEPSLVYWNKEKEEWVSVEEMCTPPNLTSSETITYKICPTVFDNEHTREKRSIGLTKGTRHPRMFTLMKIIRSTQNKKPVIMTEGPLQYQEDNATFSKIHIESYDIENDTLNYSIFKNPTNGTANLTTDGWFTYVPNRDFSGHDLVEIQVFEVNVSSPFIPTKTLKSFNITVEPTNDDPTIEFSPRTSFPYNGSSNGSLFTFIFESNITRENVYGTVSADDVDVGNKLNVTLIDKTNSTMSTFQLIKTSSNSKMISHDGPHVEMALKHHLDKEFSGSIEAVLRARDDQLDNRNLYGYSRGITIIVYALKNPCMHGICTNRTELPCTDTSRAFSFDNFACKCFSGYTGQWCETDINECKPNPCSVFYDCEDLVGQYQCVLNGPKTFGLAIGFLCFIGVPVILLWRHFKKRRPNNKISDSMIWYPRNKRTASPKRFRLRSTNSVHDVPQTSSDNSFGKSFPFQSEEQRMSAMSSLAEHNDNLRKSKLPQFKEWAMPRNEVFKRSNISRQSSDII